MEEKKESWIETLIELFRDYVENYWNDTKDPTIDNVVIYDWQWFYFGARFYSDEKVLSKKFWFIKWLVENDKIDIVKVYENLTDYEIEIRIRAVKELLENNEEDTIAYLKLLMLLSIQENPIDFLISILK